MELDQIGILGTERVDIVNHDLGEHDRWANGLFGRRVKDQTTWTIVARSILGTVKALGDRRIAMTCSDGKVDRCNDIVVVKGIDLTSFRKNPLFRETTTPSAGRAGDINWSYPRWNLGRNR